MFFDLLLSTSLVNMLSLNMIIIFSSILILSGFMYFFFFRKQKKEEKKEEEKKEEENHIQKQIEQEKENINQNIMEKKDFEKTILISEPKIIDEIKNDIPDKLQIDNISDNKETFSNTEFENGNGWWSDVSKCQSNGSNQLYCKSEDKWLFPY